MMPVVAVHLLLLAFVSAAAGCTMHAGSDAYPDAGSGSEPGAALLQSTNATVADELAASSQPSAHAGPTGLGAARTAVAGRVAMDVTLSRLSARASGPLGLVRINYLATAQATADRPPLNIALVLDRSESMAQGRKLSHAIDAARRVVDNLTDHDTLAIVAFNDRAMVLSAAGRVVNKAFLYHRLEEIAPEGATDLSAGLIEGITQLGSRDPAAQISHVLLLTDGLANRGETRLATLQGIAQRARAQGIGISTLGVGTEFDESLLAGIAAAAGGRYTYVKTPEQIPAAFRDELHGLLQVVAQNVTIELSVDGGRIGKLNGQPLDPPVSAFRVPIGDLRATERGFVFAEITPDGSEGGAPLKIDARLVFDDPQASRRIARAGPVHGSLAGQTGGDILPEDHGMALLAGVLDALAQAEAAARGLDAERYRRTQSAFEGLYVQAREQAVRAHDQDLLNQAFVLKHFMAELSAAERMGLLHGHREAQQRLQKESHYLRYLLMHHRPPS